MLIVVPMFLPLVANLRRGPIWFGIVTVVAAEIGLLTPPFGLSVFVIKSTLDDARLSLGDIFRGALPFAATMFVVLILIILVPRIATVLLLGLGFIVDDYVLARIVDFPRACGLSYPWLQKVVSRKNPCSLQDA